MQGMEPADILDLVDVGDPRLSPDGQLVAFTVQTVDQDANRYRSRVWLASTRGTQPGGPQPRTGGPVEMSGLAWSRAGTTIAFASARQESWDLDLAQDIWTVDATARVHPELRRLTATGPVYSRPPWSPQDPSRIAVVRADN